MTEGDKIQETTIKVKIPRRQRSRMCMIFSAQAIEENRKPSTENLTDKVATLLLRAPWLTTVIVSLARFADRYGFMPKRF